VSLFDTRTGETLSSLPTEKPLTKLAQVHPDIAVGGPASVDIFSFKISSSAISGGDWASTPHRFTCFVQRDAESFICGTEFGRFEIRKIFGLDLIDSWDYENNSTWYMFILDSQLLTHTGNSGIVTWDLRTKTIKNQFNIPNNHINEVRYFKSENVVMVGTVGGEVIFLNPENFSELKKFQVGAAILSVYESFPGIILVQTQEAGLLILDPCSGKYLPYPHFIDSREQWRILENGNVVSRQQKNAVLLLDFNFEFWNILKWLFLGRSDSKSLFGHLPVEVVFHFVQLASPLRFFLEVNNFWGNK
jgi:hypothetical protein